MSIESIDTHVITKADKFHFATEPAERHCKAQCWVREHIWDLYGDLKVYTQAPNESMKEDIQGRFDELCATRTSFTTLNQALKRLHRNKAELLLVLEKPWLPHVSTAIIKNYFTI
jgi:hypothetical protein